MQDFTIMVQRVARNQGPSYCNEIKGERNLNAYWAPKLRPLQTMNFDTNLIKIGGELWKVMDNWIF